MDQEKKIPDKTGWGPPLKEPLDDAFTDDRTDSLLEGPDANL